MSVIGLLATISEVNNQVVDIRKELAIYRTAAGSTRLSEGSPYRTAPERLPPVASTSPSVAPCELLVGKRDKTGYAICPNCNMSTKHTDGSADEGDYCGPARRTAGCIPVDGWLKHHTHFECGDCGCPYVTQSYTEQYAST